MGETFRIDFGEQSSPGRGTGPETGPRHFNVFREPIPGGQPSAPFYAADGLKRFTLVTDGGKCRGIISLDENAYAVSGTRVVKLDSAGTVTTLVGGIPGTDPVFMTRNEKSETPQIVAVVTGKRFLIEDDVMSEITDTDLPPPNSVTTLNSRVIYTIQDGRFFWSDIDAADVIQALNFATAEGLPDGLVRGFAHRLDLWLFGAKSVEVWRDTGNIDDQYRRISGVLIPIGCLAPASVAALDLALFWIGDNFKVYRSDGYRPEPISHFGVSRSIKAETSSITATAHFSGGHGFYTISGSTFTWQWNDTTRKWFERTSRQDNGQQGRWRAECHTELGLRNIFGDATTNVFYETDPDTYDEDGTAMMWRLRSPPNHAYPNRLIVDKLHLAFEVGVGLNDPDPHKSNPKVQLRYSDDGGNTWSNTQTRALGKIGQRRNRVLFTQLGTTGLNGRIWEITISSPVIRKMLYAAVDARLALGGRQAA